MSHPLDNPEYVLKNDPKGMYALTCAFPEQCEEALRISRSADADLGSFSPANIVLTGLGGSAAGGDFVRAIFDSESSLPFLVNRDYHLPAFVGSKTLVFAASYSGNTEETLSAYDDAKSKGAKLVCVTSGGELARRAKSDGFPCVIIPGGQPPRTALGYMMVPVLEICERLGYVPAQPFGPAVETLGSVRDSWRIEREYEGNESKRLAQYLHGRVSVIYGLGSWQGLVAYRWKGQICENSKNLTFSHSFPELNHNEVLGWVKADSQGVEQWVAIILEDDSASPKMAERARVTSELISGVAQVHRAKAVGTSLLEKILSLTYLGDFVSLYLAALNEVDPENIDSINILKAALSKVP